jgi:hemin uptake protein HemP
MTTRKTKEAEEKQPVEDESQGIVESVRGHDHIVIEDEDGTEYTLRYTRRLIKSMEAKGVTSQRVAEMLSDGTLTGAEDMLDRFVLPAFKVDQPDTTLDEVIGIWERLPDKQHAIAYLIGLYMQPTLAITTDPTKSRMQFRLV